jgi:hypothetical protein
MSTDIPYSNITLCLIDAFNKWASYYGYNNTNNITYVGDVILYITPKEDGNYYCIGRVISKTDRSDLKGDLIVNHIRSKGDIRVRHSSPLTPELLIAKLNSDR